MIQQTYLGKVLPRKLFAQDRLFVHGGLLHVRVRPVGRRRRALLRVVLVIVGIVVRRISCCGGGASGRRRGTVSTTSTARRWWRLRFVRSPTAVARIVVPGRFRRWWIISGTARSGSVAVKAVAILHNIGRQLFPRMRPAVVTTAGIPTRTSRWWWHASVITGGRVLVVLMVRWTSATSRFRRHVVVRMMRMVVTRGTAAGTTVRCGWRTVVVMRRTCRCDGLGRHAGSIATRWWSGRWTLTSRAVLLSRSMVTSGVRRNDRTRSKASLQRRRRTSTLHCGRRDDDRLFLMRWWLCFLLLMLLFFRLFLLLLSLRFAGLGRSHSGAHFCEQRQRVSIFLFSVVAFFLILGLTRSLLLVIVPTTLHGRVLLILFGFLLWLILRVLLMFLIMFHRLRRFCRRGFDQFHGFA